MAHIGYLSFLLALICAIYAIVVSIIGLLSGLNNRTARWISSAATALHAVAALLTCAMLLLLYFLVQRNFRIEYVAQYTDIHLPAVYVISALWAGQKGSLLFWGWVLSLCNVLFLRQYTKEIPASPSLRQEKIKESAYLHIVLAATIGFFLVLLLQIANPFQQLPFTPQDGKGLSPLLQNVYMAIHPPVLFIGYAGFVIPFALAFAALCTGKICEEWLKYIRRWTLFSWYCLGIGIILGAHWAYLELGWGGYWAWDPVENASFIPWLAGTALIHTLILQKRRGLLKIWNIFLCILSFSLCLLATFITRSGMIDSVHAFGESVIGYYFLTFLLAIFACAAGLIIFRWKRLQSQEVFPSLFSKEGGVLLSNQLFMGLGIAVLYGTLYPFVFEVFTGKKVSVGTGFFIMISIPVGLVILGMLGICQLAAWKKASSGTVRRKLLFALGVTCAVILLLFALGVRHPIVVLTCGPGCFIVSTICLEIWQSVVHQRKRLRKSYVAILAASINAQRQRYAGYIFHLGVVFVYIGIAVSSTYRLEQEVVLQPGESSALGNIRFRYERLYRNEDARNTRVSAEVSVYRNDKKITTITPEQRLYRKSADDSQMTTEIGLHSSFTRDMYVILADWEDDQTAMFTFIINPLILWIWIGGFLVFSVGILIVAFPKL